MENLLARRQTDLCDPTDVTGEKGYEGSVQTVNANGPAVAARRVQAPACRQAGDDPRLSVSRLVSSYL